MATADKPAHPVLDKLLTLCRGEKTPRFVDSKVQALLAPSRHGAYGIIDRPYCIWPAKEKLATFSRDPPRFSKANIDTVWFPGASVTAELAAAFIRDTVLIVRIRVPLDDGTVRHVPIWAWRELENGQPCPLMHESAIVPVPMAILRSRMKPAVDAFLGDKGPTEKRRTMRAEYGRDTDDAYPTIPLDTPTHTIPLDARLAHILLEKRDRSARRASAKPQTDADEEDDEADGDGDQPPPPASAVKKEKKKAPRPKKVKKEVVEKEAVEEVEEEMASGHRMDIVPMVRPPRLPGSDVKLSFPELVRAFPGLIHVYGTTPAHGTDTRTPPMDMTTTFGAMHSPRAKRPDVPLAPFLGRPADILLTPLTDTSLASTVQWGHLTQASQRLVEDAIPLRRPQSGYYGLAALTEVMSDPPIAQQHYTTEFHRRLGGGPSGDMSGLSQYKIEANKRIILSAAKIGAVGQYLLASLPMPPALYAERELALGYVVHTGRRDLAIHWLLLKALYIGAPKEYHGGWQRPMAILSDDETEVIWIAMRSMPADHVVMAGDVPPPAVARTVRPVDIDRADNDDQRNVLWQTMAKELCPSWIATY